MQLTYDFTMNSFSNILQKAKLSFELFLVCWIFVLAVKMENVTSSSEHKIYTIHIHYIA